jgi:hypothetical protein
MAEGQMTPNAFRGTYYVYQGVTDVTQQIELGGKGQYVNGDATMNYDNPDEPRVTFEDIDGIEAYEYDGQLYILMQEDSGNQYGERVFLAPIEHEDDGKELTYYLLAISGGALNTRIVAGVSIPFGTFGTGTSHEFSGSFDASSFFVKDADGEYVLSASGTGYDKRRADAMVPINEKSIVMNLQAHSFGGGILATFQLDRGGQIYLLRPNLPEDSGDEDEA